MSVTAIEELTSECSSILIDAAKDTGLIKQIQTNIFKETNSVTMNIFLFFLFSF